MDWGYIITLHYIALKSQDYGDVSARNTTRAPNSMQNMSTPLMPEVILKVDANLVSFKGEGSVTFQA